MDYHSYKNNQIALGSTVGDDGLPQREILGISRGVLLFARPDREKANYNDRNSNFIAAQKPFVSGSTRVRFVAPSQRSDRLNLRRRHRSNGDWRSARTGICHPHGSIRSDFSTAVGASRPSMSQSEGSGQPSQCHTGPMTHSDRDLIRPECCL